MKFRSGQEYVVEDVGNTPSNEGKKIFEALNSLEGLEKLAYLTEKINEICTGNQVKSLVANRGTQYEDVVYSNLESLLAILLMLRGRSHGMEFEKSRDLGDLCKCFLDLDYSIHFCLAPETLGICSYYRMYFFPKDTGLVDLQNSFLSNEFNVIRLTLEQDCRFIKIVRMNFNFPDFDPSVQYMFLSQDTEKNELFFDLQRVSALSQFMPFLNSGPIFDLPLKARLETLLNLEEYTKLVDYRFEPVKLSIKVSYASSSAQR